MATRDDVRRIALALPETTEDPGDFKFLVDGKQFVWRWLERLEPKKARVPNESVIVVRVATEFEKHALVDMDPAVFFTEPHYDGYAAVMVRLAEIDVDLLETLIADAWRTRAPKRLLAELPKSGKSKTG